MVLKGGTAELLALWLGYKKSYHRLVLAIVLA